MKQYHLLFALSCLFACTPIDPDTPPLDECFFCTTVSPGPTPDLAEGVITQQNAGPKRAFEVSEASIVWLEANLYSLQYWFMSGDSLEIIIGEATDDFNYHFPKPTSENHILEIYFNEDFVTLKDAALSLQPRPEENGFHTVVNIHTELLGDWNGTVNRVPFLQ